MKNRKPANKRKHKRQFSRTAQKTHKFNVKAKPMRGGVTL